MGKFTDKVSKNPRNRPFGQGTAALVASVLSEKSFTTVEQFILAYGQEDALADFVDWLPTASPNQHWTCEVEYQNNNLISYLDPASLTVMIRETPKGRWLPYSIPCESFQPDESLRTLFADAAEDNAHRQKSEAKKSKKSKSKKGK